MRSKKTTTTDVHNSSVFVRNTLIKRIYGSLKDGKSIRLAGLPHIGVTTIMRRIHSFCHSEGEWGDLFFGFYISNRYDQDGFKSQIISQLGSQGYTGFSFNSNMMRETCIEAVEFLRAKFPNKRVIFLLDDFQKNFREYHKNRDANYTMLTEQAVTDIRNLSEENSSVIFIVSYTYPLDVLLITDWYLNNFLTVPVDLLTDEEARELVEISRRNAGLEINDRIIRTILYYGGRHPQILDRSSMVDFNNNSIKNELLQWINHRFIVVEQFIISKDKELGDPNPSTLEMMCDIASEPLNKKPEHEFLAKYCYEEINGDEIKYKLFSEYFSEYLLSKQRSLNSLASKNFNLKILLKFFLGIIPFVICISLVFLPAVQTWTWLQSHPNRLGLYMSAIAFGSGISWAIIDSKRRQFALSSLALAALAVFMQIVGK